MRPDLQFSISDRIRLRRTESCGRARLFAVLDQLGYTTDPRRAALFGMSEKTIRRWRAGGPVRDVQMALVIRVMSERFSEQLAELGITPSLDAFFVPTQMGEAA